MGLLEQMVVEVEVVGQPHLVQQQQAEQVVRELLLFGFHRSSKIIKEKQVIKLCYGREKTQL
jgi:hypothetical protein